MNIVFISNYFNHHQKSVSDELYILTKGCFFFIETEYMDDERKKLGWKIEEIPRYVININEDRKKSLDIINNAQFIITGSAPESIIKIALKHKVIIFRYAERPFKDGINFSWKTPLRVLRSHVSTLDRSNIYMLCASAYTSADYMKYHLFKKKTFKWGYFPKTVVHENINKLIEQKEVNSILWCGRLIDWKHPDNAIAVAKYLKSKGHSFQMNIIGNGILEDEIIDQIYINHLEENVHFLGALSPMLVRDKMEKASIYLFTSDYKEGWGAVLNEAMNSGCAVIASHAAGSTPYLIQNKVNGYIYKSGNVKSLCEITENLIRSRELREKIGIKAYETIVDEWNGEVASKRLFSLMKNILANNKKIFFDEGPCSFAEPIENDWFTNE